MARQLRHHYAGGWYHITTRGMGRQAIFADDRDREYFLELLTGMVERYGVVLHAYVLMGNHYHLLIETPSGNASRALQWLNLSYSMWYKAKRNHSGPLFQARLRESPPPSRSAGRRSSGGFARRSRNAQAGIRTRGHGVVSCPSRRW